MNMNDVNEVIKLLDGHYAVKPLARSRMDPEPEPLPTEIHNVMREHIYFSAGFENSALRKCIRGVSCFCIF